MVRQKIVIEDGRYKSQVSKSKVSEITPGSLVIHRISVNGWSFEKIVKFGLYEVQRSRSLYKKVDGTWTADRNEAYFRYWHPRIYKGKVVRNQYAEVKYQKYWLVDDTEYYDYDSAFEVLYEKLFIKPIMPILIDVVCEFLDGAGA